MTFRKRRVWRIRYHRVIRSDRFLTKCSLIYWLILCAKRKQIDFFYAMQKWAYCSTHGQNVYQCGKKSHPWVICLCWNLCWNIVLDNGNSIEDTAWFISNNTKSYISQPRNWTFLVWYVFRMNILSLNLIIWLISKIANIHYCWQAY